MSPKYLRPLNPWLCVAVLVAVLWVVWFLLATPAEGALVP